MGRGSWTSGLARTTVALLDPLAPSLLRPELLSNRCDAGAHATEVLRELLVAHLVATGEITDEGIDVGIFDRDPALPRSTQLLVLVYEFLPGVLSQLRQ